MIQGIFLTYALLGPLRKSQSCPHWLPRIFTPKSLLKKRRCGVAPPAVSDVPATPKVPSASPVLKEALSGTRTRGLTFRSLRILKEC